MLEEVKVKGGERGDGMEEKVEGLEMTNWRATEENWESDWCYDFPDRRTKYDVIEKILDLSPNYVIHIVILNKLFPIFCFQVQIDSYKMPAHLCLLHFFYIAKLSFSC